LFIKTVKNPQHLIIHSEIGPPVAELEIVVQMGKIPRKDLGLYSNFWRVTIKN
jgi:hypothetical protein